MNILGVCLHKFFEGGTAMFTQIFVLNNASVKPMDWHFNGLTLPYPFSIVR